jgi:hypothetical protein
MRTKLFWSILATLTSAAVIAMLWSRPTLSSHPSTPLSDGPAVQHGSFASAFPRVSPVARSRAMEIATARGWKPGNTFLSIRRGAPKRISSGPNITKVQDWTYSDSAGEFTVWDWDSGDPSTAAATLYVEDYSTGDYVYYDLEVDFSGVTQNDEDNWGESTADLIDGGNNLQFAPTPGPATGNASRRSAAPALATAGLLRVVARRDDCCITPEAAGNYQFNCMMDNVGTFFRNAAIAAGFGTAIGASWEFWGEGAALSDVIDHAIGTYIRQNLGSWLGEWFLGSFDDCTADGAIDGVASGYCNPGDYVYLGHGTGCIYPN